MFVLEIVITYATLAALHHNAEEDDVGERRGGEHLQMEKAREERQKRP